MSEVHDREREARERVGRAIIAYRRSHVNVIAGLPADTIAAFEEWNAYRDAVEARVRWDQQSQAAAAQREREARVRLELAIAVQPLGLPAGEAPYWALDHEVDTGPDVVAAHIAWKMGVRHEDR